MTENNAIERCDMLINGLSIDNSTNNAFKGEGKDYPTFATMKEFAKTCKKALEKVQQYEAIGTMEEVKALKEKNTPKKRGIWKRGHTCCPNCERGVLTEDRFCFYCGQALKQKET